MQFSSRFSTAIYALCIISEYPKHSKKKITSDVIAETVGNNPVSVRRILGRLKKAGYINISPGKAEGGTTLVKPLNEITFLEILDLIEPNISESLLKSSLKLGKNNYSGICAGEVLTAIIEEGVNALREKLRNITLADFLLRIEEKEANGPYNHPRELFKNMDPDT